MRTIPSEVAARLLTALDNKLQTLPKGIARLSSADKENLSAAKGFEHFQVNSQHCTTDSFLGTQHYYNCTRYLPQIICARQYALCML